MRAPPRVTPLAGVWIETGVQLRQCGRGDVTPLAGVWIETRSWDVEEEVD